MRLYGNLSSERLRRAWQVIIHPPRLCHPWSEAEEDYAAGFTTTGAAGSPCDRTGSDTLRALSHAPISSALSPNRVDLKLVSRLEVGSGAVAMRYEPNR